LYDLIQMAALDASLSPAPSAINSRQRHRAENGRSELSRPTLLGSQRHEWLNHFILYQKLAFMDNRCHPASLRPGGRRSNSLLYNRYRRLSPRISPTASAPLMTRYVPPTGFADNTVTHPCVDNDLPVAWHLMHGWSAGCGGTPHPVCHRNIAPSGGYFVERLCNNRFDTHEQPSSFMNRPFGRWESRRRSV
jgi:hypothetical protein